MEILKCSCGSYGLSEECSCGKKRVSPKPAKFSYPDKYVRHRIDYRKENDLL